MREFRLGCPWEFEARRRRTRRRRPMVEVVGADTCRESEGGRRSLSRRRGRRLGIGLGRVLGLGGLLRLGRRGPASSPVLVDTFCRSRREGRAIVYLYVFFDLNSTHLESMHKGVVTERTSMLQEVPWTLRYRPRGTSASSARRWI